MSWPELGWVVVAIAATFGAVTIPRMHKDWDQSLDSTPWPEPGWIAVIIAAVVGTYTIRNVQIARRAYVESTFDRKVSQARLVWAELGLSVGKSKGTKAGDMGAKGLGAEQSRLIGDARGDYEARDENGQQYSVVARDLTVFRIRITNNSNEPIGRCWVRLSGSISTRLLEGTSGRWEHRATEPAVRVLPPDTTRTIRFVVPVPLTEIRGRRTRVTITFTDSAGHRWERTDTRPPKEIPKYQPPRLQKLRGWKSRTTIRVKAFADKLRTRS